MTPKELHKSAVVQFEQLAKQYGHTFVISDVPYLLALEEQFNVISGIVTNKSDIYLPVQVGDVVLNRLTIAKSEVMESLDFDDLEKIWLMSLPNDAESLPSNKPSKKELRKFHRRLTCTQSELAKAIALVMSDSNPSNDGEEGQLATLPIVDILLSEYGNTAEHWLYECDVHTLNGLIGSLSARKESEGSDGSMTMSQANAWKRIRVIRSELIKIWSVI